MSARTPAAASAWMLLSMSCIAIVDGMAKHLARVLSGVQVAWGYFLATFLALDFLRYWLHRLHHRVPFFWQFHRVHHSSEHLNATSGLRMHAFDLVQLALHAGEAPDGSLAAVILDFDPADSGLAHLPTGDGDGFQEWVV